ncbi:IS66 family insertion sequence element accessory protein TnpB [Intestinibacter bartlettii]
MLNIDKVKDVYLACGASDFRKSIDGLALIVETQLKKGLISKCTFCVL